jgi:hypothetical protein
MAAFDYRSPRHRTGSGCAPCRQPRATEVVGPIRSSLDGGLGAAALVVNVVSSDGNGLDTLYDFPKIFKGRFLACLAACPT